MSSIFEAPGLYLRNPRGGVENVAAMAAAGFRAIAINVRDHDVVEWRKVRDRASAAGVTVLPWARCLTEPEVAELCRIGREEFDRRALVNCENELFGDPPAVSLECVERETRGLDAALSMLAWVGTPPLDMRKVSRLTIHLQLFPQENETSRKPRDCRAHAYNAGAARVEFMLGVHGLAPAAFPARQGAYWGYAADDMAGEYAVWSPETAKPLALSYTGPLYGPSRPDKAGGKRSGTAKALKIACHAAGVANFPKPDRVYNAALEQALARLQRAFGIQPTGQYGRGTYELVKTLRSVTPGAGYALGPAAIALIEEDA